MRYFAAFCVPADFTDLRLISQKHGKSGQIADVCSSQIVVKICGFTTKDFADDYIIAYFSPFEKRFRLLKTIYSFNGKLFLRRDGNKGANFRTY